MNDLVIFENPEFGQVRTMNKDGEPWFVAVDVCKALEISNNRMAINRLDDDEKGVSLTDTLGGKQDMTIINESGLYSLVLGSRKPEAKKFKRWITHEVIPSIRRTGGYIAGQENLSDSELMAKALLVAQRTIEERNKQIETMKPKAIFADAVSGSDTSILIRDLAKLLKQNGVDIGEKRLYKKLRDDGYLIKIGESKNTPTQKAMEMKLFEIKESVIIVDGKSRVVKTTKVTGKGQTYFINRFLEEN
mgnify:CR=1 FL=1